ncbi:hypothetical protein D3C87_2106880 [compost metagenome]
MEDDKSTAGASYGLRRQTESQAFKKLTEALISQIRAERAAQPSPKPSPESSVAPSTAPSAAPSEPSPSP